MLTKLTPKLAIGIVVAIFILLGTTSVTKASNPIEEKKEAIKKIEHDLKEYEKEIEQRQSEEFSYASHLEILTTKLTQNEAAQEHLNRVIELAEIEITDTESSIKVTSTSLEHQQSILSSYLRDLQRYDQANKMLLLLNSANFSEFYNQVNFTENISEKTYGLVDQIDTEKEELETARDFLLNKKLEHQSLLADLKIYQTAINRSREELDIMRQQNADDIKNLEDAVAHTSGIRDQLKQELFAMTREGRSIEFEEAAKHARFASKHTGIRPELIMSIVKQETNFGNNVGNGFYKTDMKSDQWETFVQICLELGRDPETTRVSAKPRTYSGWGGAMGIAQFLPTTWLTVKEETASITGHSPPDPWEPIDAFVAVGLKMRGLGAANDSADAEWEAAGRYFAGGNFKKYPWYGTNVINRAEQYKIMLGQIAE